MSNDKGNRMTLLQAEKYAERIVTWLAPFCHRIEVAGSIRRERPDVGDIDIVCIPKTEDSRDLFGAVTTHRNLLLEFLQAYVREKNPSDSKITPPYFISGGERAGNQVLLQLPKCQLDLWFSTEETFATRLLCRTGSKEHNIWLAERAQTRDCIWRTYEGLEGTTHGFPNGEIMRFKTETEIYAALGLELIAPKNREAAWIARHLEFGL